MSEENEINAGERELERALMGLKPVGVGNRREAIAYEAGRRAGRKNARVWRGAAGVMVVVLIGVVGLRPVEETRVAEKGMDVKMVNEDRGGGVSPMAGNYLAMREEVLNGGVDVLRPAGMREAGSGEGQRVMEVKRVKWNWTDMMGGRL